MRYYIIEKLELVATDVVTTELKYTTSETTQNEFNDLHYTPFVASELPLTDYLELNGHLYQCTLSTTVLTGREGLVELTDINIPE